MHAQIKTYSRINKRDQYHINKTMGKTRGHKGGNTNLAHDAKARPGVPLE